MISCTMRLMDFEDSESHAEFSAPGAFGADRTAYFHCKLERWLPHRPGGKRHGQIKYSIPSRDGDRRLRLSIHADDHLQRALLDLRCGSVSRQVQGFRGALRSADSQLGAP